MFDPLPCPRCAAKDEQNRRLAERVAVLELALTAYVRADERRTRGTRANYLSAMFRRARALALRAWT